MQVASKLPYKRERKKIKNTHLYNSCRARYSYATSFKNFSLPLRSYGLSWCLGASFITPPRLLYWCLIGFSSLSFVVSKDERGENRKERKVVGLRVRIINSALRRYIVFINPMVFSVLIICLFESTMGGRVVSRSSFERYNLKLYGLVAWVLVKKYVAVFTQGAVGLDWLVQQIRQKC